MQSGLGHVSDAYHSFSWITTWPALVHCSHIQSPSGSSGSVGSKQSICQPRSHTSHSTIKSSLPPSLQTPQTADEPNAICSAFLSMMRITHEKNLPAHRHCQHTSNLKFIECCQDSTLLPLVNAPVQYILVVPDRSYRDVVGPPPRRWHPC